MEAEEMEALPPRWAFTTVPAVPLGNAELLYISLPEDYPNTQKWAGRYLEAQTCSQAYPHVENFLQCLLKLQRLLNTGPPAINDIDVL